MKLLQNPVSEELSGCFSSYTTQYLFFFLHLFLKMLQERQNQPGQEVLEPHSV